jgi:prophage maintenance system killer protein
MILLAFLGLNSRRLAANPQDLELLVLGIADGRVSKAEAAVFVQKHLRTRSGK